MSTDVRSLLPDDKGDVGHAEQLVLLGYPAVEPVLTELFEWLQDGNWPVAHVIAPLLASIGTPIVPNVRRVLNSDDDIWKYWVLSMVVAEATSDVARGLLDDLERIARTPSRGETEEEVDKVASGILRRMTI